MKVIYLTIALGLGGSFLACAQDIPQNEVPSVVLNAFQARYPNATDVEWEKKGEFYHVEYDLGRTDHEVWLDASGKLVKHEEDIPKAQLPDAVKQTVSSQFGKYRIDDTDKIEKDGRTYYKIGLEGSMGDRTIFTDAAGKVIADPSFLY